MEARKYVELCEHKDTLEGQIAALDMSASCTALATSIVVEKNTVVCADKHLTLQLKLYMSCLLFFCVLKSTCPTVKEQLHQLQTDIDELKRRKSTISSVFFNPDSIYTPYLLYL